MTGVFYRCDKLQRVPSECVYCTWAPHLNTIGLVESEEEGVFIRTPDVSPSECYWMVPLWANFLTAE